MKLFEFNEQDISTGFYDPQRDKVNTLDAFDTRKKKIMLSDLNKLKRMRALKKLDILKRQDLLSIIYGDTSSDEDSGPAF